MRPGELFHTVAALRSSRHPLEGVRPADSEPSEAAFLLVDDSLQSLDEAAISAAGYWPECDRWALVGGTRRLPDRDDHWPPGLHRLDAPVRLSTFIGRTGV